MNYVSACLVVIGCLFADPLGQLSAAEKDVVYGKASWYGQEYCKKYSPRCITASGEPFTETALTAACHPRWRLGAVLRVRHANNRVDVRCNDRGSFTKKYGRILDLSKGAFQQLAPLSKGVIRVQIEEIN